MMWVYRTGQVAKMFGVSIQTVNKWVDTGLLNGFRMPGTRHRRVTKEDLDAFRKTCGWPEEVTTNGHSE